MKKGQVISLVIILSLILGLMLGIPFLFDIQNLDDPRRPYYEDSWEIMITRDVDFEKYYNFSGSGTETDPYLIEDFLFTNNRSGIWIDSTTHYFIIRNCTFNTKYDNILLRFLPSNTATIMNCTIITSLNLTYGVFGVLIEYCQGVKLIDNIFKGPLRDENNVQDFSWNSRGILIEYSSDIQIFNNDYFGWYAAFYVRDSDNIMISNNNVYNCLFGIHSRDVFGLLMIANTFEKISYGQFIEDTDYLSIIANTLCKNENGFLIMDSDYGYIYGNNCSNNDYSGIGLLRVNWYQVSDNFCYNNTHGIKVGRMSNSNITRNQLEFNNHYGLYIDSSSRDNLIHHNNFINNNLTGFIYLHKQAFEDSSTTTNIFWFDNDINEGNFWSDLIWNEGVIYEIDGGNNTDPYPLENPVDF